MQMLLTREAVLAHRLLFEAHVKRAVWWLAISAIPMLIGICLLVLNAPDQREAPRLVQTWERVFSALALASLLGGVAWSLFCVSCAELQLRCPGCRASIGNLHRLVAVMASNRCPRCEQVIVGEAGTPFENREHGTPQQTYEQLELKGMLWPLATWGSAGAFWCIVTKLMLDHWQTSLEAAVGEIAYPFVRVLVFAPGIVIFHLGLLHAYRSAESKSKKCSHCRESVSGEVAGLTGCCGNCGGIVRPDRVFAQTEPPTKNMLGVKEFQQLTHQANAKAVQKITRRAMAAFSIIFVGMAAIPWMGERLSIVVTFVTFSLFLREMWKIDQTEKKIKCDSCSQPLLHSRWWVIASRRCVGCGCRVLKD